MAGISQNHWIWATPVSGSDEQCVQVVDHLLRRGRKDEPHEPSFRVLSIISEMLAPEEQPLVLDIGANQGSSVVSISRVLPQAKVISFEPTPWCIRSLEYLKSISSKLPADFSFDYQNVGLGSAPGELEIWVPGSDDFMITSVGSVHKEALETASFKQSIAYMFDGDFDLKLHRFPIKIERLDDFKYRPHAIKIDVEGHEIPVLEGGAETIGENKPLMIIETGPSMVQIRDRLERIGYKAFLFDDSDKKLYAWGTKHLNGNTCFLHEKHIDAGCKIDLIATK